MVIFFKNYIFVSFHPGPFCSIRPFFLEVTLNSYFGLCHLFMDVLGFQDKFFLVSLMSFFILNMLGSIFAGLFRKILVRSKDEDVNNILPLNNIFTVEKNKFLLNLKKLQFWKYYHLQQIYYEIYGRFQGFSLIVGYWYFKPSIKYFSKKWI